MKKIIGSYLLIIISLWIVSVANAGNCPELVSGDVFKVTDEPAVYVLNEQNYRSVFKDADMFLSWFPDFSKVKEISAACAANYADGPAATYRPGSRLVTTGTAEVYAIAPGNMLLKIEDESVAAALYGNAWTKKVRRLNETESALYTKKDETIEKPMPHDGMFVEIQGILYYLENGRLAEITKPYEVPKHIEIFKINTDIFLMPLTVSGETIQQILIRNLLRNTAYLYADEQQFVSGAFKNLASLSGMRQNATIYFENIVQLEPDQATDPLLASFNSGRIVAHTEIDAAACDQTKKSITLSFEPKDDFGNYASGGVLDIRSFKKQKETTTFFELRQFVSEDPDAKLLYEVFQDRWIRYKKSEFDRESNSIDPITNDPIIAAANCGSNGLFGLDTDKALTIHKNFDPDVIDGLPMRHFGFTADKKMVQQLLLNSLTVLDEDFDLDSLAQFEGVFSFFEEGIDSAQGELWIAKADGMPRKLSVTLNKGADREESAITYEVEFSNFGESFIIEEPQESVSLFQVLQELIDALFGSYDFEITPPAFEPVYYDILPVDFERDHLFGDRNAPITMIEYVDFACPYCKSFHPTLKEVVEAYAGEVNWVIRQYPLTEIHEDAEFYAHLTECSADQGRFWEAVDIVFAYPRLNIRDYAEKIRVSERYLANCISQKINQDKIVEDIEDGSLVGAGLFGVPHMIIVGPNDRMTEVNGAQSFETLTEIIDQLIISEY